MSENTIESIKEGLARYTKTRTAEESMNNAAVQAFVDAMVEQGRLTEAQVAEVTGARYSLQGAVADILNRYDEGEDLYNLGVIQDVADAIDALIADSTEDTTELENILNDFRYAQEDARNWGGKI